MAPTLTQQRIQIIDWLNRHNGEITPDLYESGYSYLERGELMKDADWKGTPQAWTSILKAMEDDKQITRQVEGRRMKSISLAKSLRKEPERRTPDREPDDGIDYDEVARRLLDQVVDVIQRPLNLGSDLEGVQVELEQVKGRLADQQGETQKLRRQLLDAHDDIKERRQIEDRLRNQNDWFRQRIKDLGKHVPEPIAEKTRREVDKLMREVPARRG